jgi:hypothetical protein
VKGAVAPIVVTLAICTGAGCGGDGGGGSGDEKASIEAYCAYVYERGQEFRSRYQSGDVEDLDQTVAAMFSLIAAPRDLASFFDGMADVSPPEVKSDVEAIRDGFGQMADNTGKALSDPLGTLVESVGAGLSNAGAMERFDAYTLEQCGPPPVDPTSAEPAQDELPAEWPPDDPRTAIGIECDGGVVTLWKFGEDQQPAPFHTVDVGQALADSDAPAADATVDGEHCTGRTSWSQDFRKVVFPFLVDDKEERFHIAVLDLETMEVADLTEPRQEGREFGSTILDERGPTFLVAHEPGGGVTLSDDEVVFSSDVVLPSGDDSVGAYSKVSISDPTTTKLLIPGDEVRDLPFEQTYHPFGTSKLDDLCGADSCNRSFTSPDGRWEVSAGEDWVDGGRTKLGPLRGIDELYDSVKGAPVRCTGADGVPLGWIDADRFVMWEARVLVVVTVSPSGELECGRNLMPENDYSFSLALAALSLDGRYVYISGVNGAAASDYRFSVDGGAPEELAYPDAPDGVTFFERASLP